MKKLKLLLFAALTTLVSCDPSDGKSDSTNNKNNTITNSGLISKIVQIDAKSGEVITTIFNFNGNQLSSVNYYSPNVGDIGKKMIYYTDSRITKIESYDSQLNGTRTYNYTDGKLSSSTDDSATGYLDKKIYTYNADGTIDYTITTTTNATNETLVDISGKLTFDKNNLTNMTAGTTIRSYEYDSKNSAFKNIGGFNLLLDNDILLDRGSGLSMDNNVIKSELIIKSYPMPDLKTTSYNYNTKDYPTEGKTYDKSGKLLSTIQYFYN
jgi:hypothetical protein